MGITIQREAEFAARNKHDSISQMRFSKLLRSGMLCTNDFSAGVGTRTKGVGVFSAAL